MSSNSQPGTVGSPSRPDLFSRLEHYWRLVTDGLEVGQLWSQFEADTRASYRFYARGVNADAAAGSSRWKHYLHIAGQVFWSVLEKLSPVRRLLLLLALILLVYPNHRFSSILYSWVVLLLLLLLEVTDRVVMKRDLEIAREIQRWLLPATPPQVPGMQIAFITRPANTVAGDYYDVFARPSAAGSSDRFLISVADVSGKSIPAALLMAAFQASLKTLTATPCSLKELVAAMNRYACTNSQQGLRFTTAFLAEFDPESRSLTYVNAGQNPPVLRRGSGEIQRLEAGGLPLGIIAATVYETGSVTLHSGDVLAIFTDGLIEAVNARDEEYEEQRLVNVLQSRANSNPDELLRALMYDVDAFVGSTAQHDDITCMLIRAS
ncbi:MAG TPA: PP2C family protein-serine/threonine phosphatase [Candidatus Angelobacter sp.]|nr:PP2C family protein-serine/threonine phosphatase [Candidatus Angelobacter sp.]